MPKARKTSAAAASVEDAAAGSHSPTQRTGAAMAADTPRRYWLLKSEPDTHVIKGMDVSYPFDRFKTEKDGVGIFNGVRNLQARGNLRDRLMPGNLAFFYHSSCKVPGIAGIVEVAARGQPDPDALNPAHPFYDPTHTEEKPKWYHIQLRRVRPMRRFISLAELRMHAESLPAMTLLRQPRLSVQPVTPAEWEFIMKLEDTPAPDPRVLAAKPAAARAHAKDGEASDDEAASESKPKAKAGKRGRSTSAHVNDAPAAATPISGSTARKPLASAAGTSEAASAEPAAPASRKKKR